MLKVALDPGQNARLVEEGQILHKLRHQNIVECYEHTEVSGHAALFMAVAGAEITSGAYTLAQRIRSEGRLSLNLLQETGIALVWDSTQSVYSFRHAPLEASSATSSLQRLSTTPGPGVAVSPEVEAARALEARLTRAVTERRFLRLTVAPSHLLRAEAEIVRRFAVQRLSLEAVLLREMQTTAAAVGAQWDVVLQADTAPVQSTD